MSHPRSGPICSLARFDLITANAHSLATFYENAFGCRRIAAEHVSSLRFEKLTGIQRGAVCITLRLGEECIELLQFARAGRPYPGGSSASDLIFQHFAIVVSDMAQAMARLFRTKGWTPITRGGPQRLPERAGGVTAFKFRDPEGHPLEFLAFPAAKTPPKWRKPSSDVSLGIDHSAISVADTAASRRYYENLGFRASSALLNHGPAQERLDDVAGAVVEVTALSPTDAGPHIELLCYRHVARKILGPCQNNDVAATRLVLALDDAKCPQQIVRRGLADPDAHHLMIIKIPTFQRPKRRLKSS